MRDLGDDGPTLRGTLLVAHPGLVDPNFIRSVVLISAHQSESGALGVIVNRPLHKTLGEVKADFADSVLGEVPLYEGGPVNKGEVLLTAWKWNDEEGTFQMFFGLSAERLESILGEDPDLQPRAFVGYAGWSEGQVEGELEQSAWIVAPIRPEYLSEGEGALWRTVLLNERPELSVMTDTPDNPSLN